MVRSRKPSSVLTSGAASSASTSASDRLPGRGRPRRGLASSRVGSSSRSPRSTCQRKKARSADSNRAVDRGLRPLRTGPRDKQRASSARPGAAIGHGPANAVPRRDRSGRHYAYARTGPAEAIDRAGTYLSVPHPVHWQDLGVPWRHYTPPATPRAELADAQGLTHHRGAHLG